MFKWNDNFFRPYRVEISDMSVLGKIVALEEKVKKLEDLNFLTGKQPKVLKFSEIQD